MTNNIVFSACSITPNAFDSTLYVAWLPTNPASALIGLSEQWSNGAALILDKAQTEHLTKTLEARVGLTISNPEIVGLRFSLTNRGDPYRDGLDLQIEGNDEQNCSIFLEEYEIDTLAQTLRRGLAG